MKQRYPNLLSDYPKLVYRIFSARFLIFLIRISEHTIVYIDNYIHIRIHKHIATYIDATLHPDVSSSVIFCCKILHFIFVLPASLPDESLKKMVDVLIQVPKKLLGGIEAACCANSRREAQECLSKIARSLCGVVIRNFLINSQHWHHHSDQSTPFSMLKKKYRFELSWAEHHKHAVLWRAFLRGSGVKAEDLLLLDLPGSGLPSGRWLDGNKFDTPEMGSDK